MCEVFNVHLVITIVMLSFSRFQLLVVNHYQILKKSLAPSLSVACLCAVDRHHLYHLQLSTVQTVYTFSESQASLSADPTPQQSSAQIKQPPCWRQVEVYLSCPSPSTAVSTLNSKSNLFPGRFVDSNFIFSSVLTVKTHRMSLSLSRVRHFGL